MASVVVKSSTCNQISPLFQEKVSRNKRKFRADPPLGEPSSAIPAPQNECASYEFCAEKFGFTSGHSQADACNLCGAGADHFDGLKLDLGLSSATSSSDVGPSQPNEEIGADNFQDADWNELTEAQLEELVLSNLDTIFRSAIKKIVACGYTEEVATKAVLRSGLCYGCKDTVSNIVDNTIMFLKSGQDLNSSRGHCFEDLQQLEKYILAELVCVLREVRPYFSTGDAMWCLLICDMNVSHACAMDGDLLSSFIGDSPSNGSSIQPSSKSKTKSIEPNLPSSCEPISSVSCSLDSEIEAPGAGISNSVKPESSFILGGILPGKEGTNTSSNTTDKTFSSAGPSQSFTSEDRFVGTRTSHSTKREFILRQRSFHLEKNGRTHGSKGSSKAKLSSLGGLMLDKKLKSLSDSHAVDMKVPALKIGNALCADVPQDNRNTNFPVNNGTPSPAAFSLNSSATVSGSSKSKCMSSLPTVSAPLALPEFNTNATLSTADTELCLSLPTKNNSAPVPRIPRSEARNPMYSQMCHDRSLGHWPPRDKKDEMILKLVPRVRELQNQLQQWTEWANQKVMQAARRLGKDNAELKTLRQEKRDVEQLRKDKLFLEENTMKKLNELENSLHKAGGQVERANATVRRLEVENAALRQEMDAAKLHATQSAVNCQQALEKEKRTQQRYQSWEKERTLLQEELVTRKHKVAQFLHELEQATVVKEQWEARWKQEEKAKVEFLTQARSLITGREQIEASSKCKEDMIKAKAETSSHKYKNDIQKLEKEISQLRLKTDSSKIAALRRGIDGNHASRHAETKNSRDSRMPFFSKLVPDLQDFSETGGVKRERECVMCLSEEMSVVFLPCAHQVVCKTCNELHEKQGMKECPSCRSSIQRRIHVRFARI